MKEATHDGHCQCCGRLHRLPGGKLAKHGYEVIGRGQGFGGYFSGTCWGSGELPYELSCELVKEDIERALKWKAASEKSIEALLVPPTLPVATWQHYATGPNGRGKYFEVECEIIQDDDESYPSCYIVFEFNGKRHKEWAGRHSGLRGTPLEVAHALQLRKVALIQKHVKMLEDHIKSQQERVDDWKIRPLIKRKLRA